jgi:micrococcal nuclease
LKTVLKQLVAFSLLLCCTTPLFAAEHSGRVSWVYDGDTLLIAGIGKVRLLGIDTPESKGSPRDNFYRDQFGITPQRLRLISRQAKQLNIELTKGVLVRLVTETDQRDKYGRLLAYLYLPDGRQLNRTLLKNGLATVFRNYQFSRKDDFLALEKSARTAGAGLWQP